VEKQWQSLAPTLLWERVGDAALFSPDFGFGGLSNDILADTSQSFHDGTEAGSNRGRRKCESAREVLVEDRNPGLLEGNVHD
jgi:hypothetical protein